MERPITRRTFERIRRMLARKKDVLEIESQTGVDLQTVLDIAGGWTPDSFPKPGRPLRKKAGRKKKIRKVRTPLYFEGRVKAKCPECSEMVYLPCLECHLRNNPHHGHRLRLSAASDDLSLDLKPEWKARYEEIHQRKIAEREVELDRKLLNETA